MGTARQNRPVMKNNLRKTSLTPAQMRLWRNWKSCRQVVDNYYLYDDKVDVDDMIQGIYSGFIKGLDEKYTTYYSPEEYARLQESSSGVYSGIGVMVSQNVNTGLITVVRPSEKWLRDR